MNNTCLIRRIAAIALVVLAIVCLFWPAVISTLPDYRDDKEEAYESYKDSYDKEDIAKEKKSLIKQLKDQLDFTNADAKAFVDASYVVAEKTSKPDLSMFELRSQSTASLTVMDLYDKYEIPGYKKENYSDAQQDQYDLIKITAILTNIAFFGMLAAGLAAIVLMVLNQTSAANYVFLIFALLGTAAVVYFLIRTHAIAEEYADKEGTWGIGVSLILIPVFALAACFLYKRDRSMKGASPMRTAPAYGGSAAPSYNDRNAPSRAPQQPVNGWNAQPRAPQQPVNDWNAQPRVPQRPAAPAPQPTAEAAWTYTICGASNPAGTKFCPNCGTKYEQPAPEPAEWFCPNCGTKNPADTKFCPNCGTRKA